MLSVVNDIASDRPTGGPTDVSGIKDDVAFTLRRGDTVVQTERGLTEASRQQGEQAS
jgi:hypothetical protein